MSIMNDGISWNDSVTINKQSGTKITLDTDNKYVAKDIELTINVQAGSAEIPNTTITANPTLSVNSSTGIVTANVSATESVTPTINSGFISTGTAGTMSVNGSNTMQLTTQAAQTITPGTTNQTIAAGQYLTGVQTIAGDANLIAENIVEGVSIFGISGTAKTGGNIVYYGECATADATAAKEVSISGITELSKGLSIRVKFTNAQAYDGTPTLNLNNLGAKNICRNGTTDAAIYEWLAGEVLDLVYDGTSWIIVDGGISTATYYGHSKLITMTVSQGVLQIGS